jgi:hypothetical protein
MAGNSEKGFMKWFWLFLIPIVVTLVTQFVITYFESKSNAVKVATYAKLWEEQVAKDTTRIWKDFRSDSTLNEFWRAESLKTAIAEIGMRGGGESSAVPVAKKKINLIFDSRMRKLHSEVEFRTATLIYQLNAFRKTGMVIKAM